MEDFGFGQSTGKYKVTRDSSPESTNTRYIDSLTVEVGEPTVDGNDGDVGKIAVYTFEWAKDDEGNVIDFELGDFSQIS